MRPLTARRALEAWELGQRSDPQGRALSLLASALPEVSREKLVHLPLGQRDALLMRLHERTLGHLIRGFSQCPKCDARLEYPLDLRTYDVAGTLERRIAVTPVTLDGYDIRFRVPDSEDLEAMGFCPDVGTARGLLLSRCVLSAVKEGQPVPPWQLPEPVIEELGKKMEELDPLAFLPLSIDCARCGHKWLVLLDMATLVWQAISVSAERLLRDVHILAMAYGWSESEILGMSEARRRFYLEQIPTSQSSPLPTAAPRGRGRP